MRLNAEKLKAKSAILAQSLKDIRQCKDFARLLGLEGEAASVYFSVFDDLILQQKDDFVFQRWESVRLWIMLMPCFHLRIHYWRECVVLLWRVWAWTLMWGSIIRTVQAECHWRWT